MQMNLLLDAFIASFSTQGRWYRGLCLVTAWDTTRRSCFYMHYIYMGPDVEQESKYLLLLLDDTSSSGWLWRSATATSAIATEALSKWILELGSLAWIVTDMGRHFANLLLKQLSEDIHDGHQYFTTAYCLLANRTVKKVCRQIIRACKALLHEICLSPRDWQEISASVQSLQNHVPLKTLGIWDASQIRVFRTPLEAFTGLQRQWRLLRALLVTK